MEELTAEEYCKSICEWSSWYGDNIPIHYDEKHNHVFVSYKRIWLKLEQKYNLNYFQIRELIYNTLSKDEFYSGYLTSGFLVMPRHYYRLPKDDF